MLRSPSVAANAGLAVLLLPAALVAAALAHHALGVQTVAVPVEEAFAWASANAVLGPLVPVVFLGGLAAVLAANVLAIVRAGIDRRGGTLAGTFSIDLRPRNLAVVLVSLGLLAILSSYVLAENAACWFGNQVSC